MSMIYGGNRLLIVPSFLVRGTALSLASHVTFSSISSAFSRSSNDLISEGGGRFKSKYSVNVSQSD